MRPFFNISANLSGSLVIRFWRVRRSQCLESGSILNEGVKSVILTRSVVLASPYLGNILKIGDLAAYERLKLRLLPVLHLVSGIDRRSSNGVHDRLIAIDDREVSTKYHTM